jgi:DtxR family Mn-dependent transcriptional regulator
MMKMKMIRNNEELSSSQKGYLEAIFHIVSDKRAARTKDIASRLNVCSSSVTTALHSLSHKGLINYAPYDIITLTLKGKKMAKEIVWSHEVLRSFFVNVLCVDEAEAEKNAYKMSHMVSRKILERIREMNGERRRAS